MLTLDHIVREEYDVRSSGDRRRKVTRVLAEYRDDAGDVYRKSFESAPDTRPDVPRTARTMADLNSKKFQF